MKAMKKWSAACLAVTMGLLPITAQAASFSDVSKKSWYYPYVNEFVNTGIISGYGTGKFGPEDGVTRAQFVQLIYNVMGKPSTDSAKVGFSDATGWYVPALAYAKQNHLLDNFPASDKFYGDQPLSRGEAALLLWNLLGFDDTRNVTPDTSKFPNYFKKGQAGAGKSFGDDAQLPAYAKLAISELAANDIIHGFSDGTFKPARAITRAEVSALLDTSLRKVGYKKLLDPKVSVTQQNFIDSMYTVLNHASTLEGHTVDLDHPNVDELDNIKTTPNGGGYTAEKVGIVADDPNGKVTAGLAANWLAKWAKPARGVSMDVNVTHDPFTWAKMNGWFDGTNISSSSDIVQPEDVNRMNQNLQIWLVGYKVEGHTVYFHYPMEPYETLYHWLNSKFLTKVEATHFNSTAVINQTIIAEIARYNQAKITINNSTATYYEPPLTTEKVLGFMGVPANYPDKPDLIGKWGLPYSTPMPLVHHLKSGTRYYMVIMEFDSSYLPDTVGFKKIAYAINFDGNFNITTVESGGGGVSIQNGKLIAPYGIVNNYPYQLLN